MGGWELPEENGRILPSKVARHFKQVLPSKKTQKKNKGKNNNNIKPSLAKSRTHRDFVTVTNDDKPQSMRGDTKPWSLGKFTQNTYHLSTRSQRVEISSKVLGIANIAKMEPKKSIISDLENLISADPNRSNNNNDEKNESKRERAVSMTDLDLDRSKM